MLLRTCSSSRNTASPACWRLLEYYIGNHGADHRAPKSLLYLTGTRGMSSTGSHWKQANVQEGLNSNRLQMRNAKKTTVMSTTATSTKPCRPYSGQIRRNHVAVEGTAEPISLSSKSSQSFTSASRTAATTKIASAATTTTIQSTANSSTAASTLGKIQAKGYEKKIWDDQTDALLVALKEARIPWRKIGELLDRSYTTIYCRYLNTIEPNLKRGWRPIPIKDSKIVQELIDRGRKEMAEAAAAKKAAQATEVSIAAAAKLAASNHVPRKKWDKATDQRMIEMVKMGFGWAEIAKDVGRIPTSCYTRYYSALDPALHNDWTESRLDKLRDLVGKGLSWAEIGEILQINSLSCKEKWRTVGRIEQGLDRNRSFTEAESARLLTLIEKYSEEDWDSIQQEFMAIGIEAAKGSTSKKPPREASKHQLQYQYKRLSRRHIHWTPDDETILIQNVMRHGTEGAWEQIAGNVGNHTVQECQAHWRQLDLPINPSALKEYWPKYERGSFWRLWREHGKDFEKISRHIRNRSADECRAYYDKATKHFSEDPTTFDVQVNTLAESLYDTDMSVKFTKDRSILLQRAVRFFTKSSKGLLPINWTWIASQVRQGVSPSSCRDHWQYLNENLDAALILPSISVNEEYATVMRVSGGQKSSLDWSHEEIMLLEKGIREFGANWAEIQQRYLPWRTGKAMRQRWYLISDKATQVSDNEYYTLFRLVNENILEVEDSQSQVENKRRLTEGDSGKKIVQKSIDWANVVKQMPGWTKAPCRRVWESTFQHSVASAVWTEEEDLLLLEKVLSERAHDWNGVASHFQPGASVLSSSLESRALPQQSMRLGYAVREGHDEDETEDVGDDSEDEESMSTLSPLRTRPRAALVPEPDLTPSKRKTAWQCRLRWCQLLEPHMPNVRKLGAAEGGRFVAYNLSKTLLQQWRRKLQKA